MWGDYTLEVTKNKALKGTGGIIGLTLWDNALARYFLARPVTARYSWTFKQEMTNKGKQVNSNKDLHHTDNSSQKQQWDKGVGKMTAMFDSSFIDPFDISNPSQQLVNFATGAVATQDIQSSMLGYIKKGKEMADKFVSERLVPCNDETKQQEKVSMTLCQEVV